MDAAKVIIHYHQIRTVQEALVEILQKGTPATLAIRRITAAQKKMGSRDRRQFTETTYHILRWWNKLWFAADKKPSFGEDTVTELLFISYIHRGLIPAGNAFLALQDRVPEYQQRLHNPPEPWIEVAFPEWLYEKAASDFPGEQDQLLKALNEEAEVVIRSNRSRMEPSALAGKLQESGVSCSLIGEEAIHIHERQNLSRHPLYEKGFFEFQDYHSQVVGRSIDPSPGDIIIDYCAGGGGKSLQLADLCPDCVIVASDIKENRLNELVRRNERTGFGNIEIKSQKELFGSEIRADVLLVDAPCSGTGTIKRKPEVKWRLAENDVNRYVALQKDILEKSLPLLKPGGRLVYITCSILKSEGEDQVRAFLQDHPDFQLIQETRLQPHIGGYDGFYVAALRNNEELKEKR